MFNGNKFKKLRKDKGYLQSDIAKILNLGVSTVGMWELGNSHPSDEMIVRIANIFDVSTDYLLDNEISQEFKEQSEENQMLLKAVAEGLTDPTMKALYSKASELKNDRDKKMVLNVINGFMEDVDNNEQ